MTRRITNRERDEETTAALLSLGVRRPILMFDPGTNFTVASRTSIHSRCPFPPATPQRKSICLPKSLGNRSPSGCCMAGAETPPHLFPSCLKPWTGSPGRRAPLRAGVCTSTQYFLRDDDRVRCVVSAHSSCYSLAGVTHQW